MILVTGGSGTVGGSVVQRLIEAGREVRTLYHSASSSSPPPTKVESIPGDLADIDSIHRAMEGVSAVFMCSCDEPKFVDLQQNLIDAAKQAELGVVVRLSGWGADTSATDFVCKQHGIGDQQLVESGLPYILLQPNWFFQNFLQSFPGGVMRAPVGDAEASFVDARDVAAVGAAALTGALPHNQTLVITGPESLTYYEVAKTLSNATGYKFRFESVDADTWADEAKRAGFSKLFIEGHLGLFAKTRKGAWSATTASVAEATGRPPLSLSMFGLDYANALGEQIYTDHL